MSKKAAYRFSAKSGSFSLSESCAPHIQLLCFLLLKPILLEPRILQPIITHVHYTYSISSEG